MTFCAVYKLICSFKAIYAQVSNVMNGCGVHQKRMSRKFQFSVLIIDVLIVNSPSIHCSFFYFYRFGVMRFFDLCWHSFTLTIVRRAFTRAHTHSYTRSNLCSKISRLSNFTFLLRLAMTVRYSLLTAHIQPAIISDYLWMCCTRAYLFIAVPLMSFAHHIL